ncbi:MAG TPA: PQQ-binding-like beta-propeller repeat protein, partial [Vicinamibacterales bacterium]|nr:PQQ-binding-like beta-propeller repeat protein [Vicinamibacterales bacterium]
GWGPTVENTHFQPAAQAGLSAEQVPRLHLKWAFGFPDTSSAWAQPTIAGGRLYVGGQNGTVYSLDAASGCVAWTFAAQGGVRASISIGTRSSAGRAIGYAAYFSDQKGFVYAVDAADGRLLWTRKVDEHPLVRLTGAPTLYQDRLYVPVSSLEETAASQPGYECCTFRGSLNALDVKTGAIVWQTFLAPPPQPAGKNAAGIALWGPSGVGIWSAPTIDVKRGLVYAGTGNTYSAPAQPTSDAIVAFDLKSGTITWITQLTVGDVFGCRVGSANCGEKAGVDFDLGTPPMLVTLPGGRDIIVAAQKSGNAFAIDPDKAGAQLWQYHAGEGSIWGGIQWGAAVDGERAYFPVSDIRTPKPGGLHAVSLTTGERAWYVPPPPLKCASGTGCSAALISAPTLIPGVLFSGSNDGALRAHSTKDGAVIWEFDTNRDFETLNGVRAGGGAIQGPGPTIAGGMLYLNSGYGDHLGRPGNVLLAFEVQ